MTKPIIDLRDKDLLYLQGLAEGINFGLTKDISEVRIFLDKLDEEVDRQLEKMNKEMN
jgi:hypothetical protein